jgi:predicted  nucleic acid-binding Zn-ribbon protein
MSDITELERRITAALDRIGTGLDGLAAPVAAGLDPAEIQESLDIAGARAEQLELALSDEKLANAQLEERLKSVREKSERYASAMDIQALEQQKTTAKLDAELQRLRRASEDLRQSNLSLRDALEQGLDEPHLINKAMLAELETLRATRSVEVAQADAVLAALEPLVKRAAQDAEDGDKENTDA